MYLQVPNLATKIMFREVTLQERICLPRAGSIEEWWVGMFAIN
jgi:hypothetical protein